MGCDGLQHTRIAAMFSRNEASSGARSPTSRSPEVPKNQRPKSQDTKKAEAPSKVRLAPAETVSKAAAKVTRLEAAPAALEASDDADVVEATALKEALKKARAQAAPSNPGRRFDECQQHVARAARQAAVAEAQQLEQLYQEQLAVGLADLEALRKEASCLPQTEGDSSELRDLRRQMDRGKNVMRGRQLQEAPSPWKDWEHRRSFDVDVGLIEAGDAKRSRHAVIVGEFCSLTCSPARNARYGLMVSGLARLHTLDPVLDSFCTCDEATTGSAPSDDLQPTVLDGTHGSDTESVVDALVFDMTRGDEVDQAPSTPRVGDAM